MHIVRNIDSTKFRIVLDDNTFLMQTFIKGSVGDNIPYEFNNLFAAEEFMRAWKKLNTWIKVESPQ